MRLIQTKLDGVHIIKLEPKNDARGNFVRLFDQKELERSGIQFNVAQASRSLTHKAGAVRGMHYQTNPFEESKVVQCIQGSVYDVVVDVRNSSPTFGNWIAAKLSPTNNTALFIPKGYAHGFQTLEKDSEVLYFISEYYSPEHASGVRWNDPFFKIIWPRHAAFVSPRDTTWPLYAGQKLV